MSAAPPTPNTDFLDGQHGYLVQDYATEGPYAFEYAEVLEFGDRKTVVDLVAEGIVIFGPRTTTIDLIGAKIPCDVSVTVNDATSGYPGTDTTTTYHFGPSMTSQSITLADSNFSLTRIEVGRRF